MAETRKKVENDIETTGIPENVEEVQYDLVTSLLEAANYKEDEENLRKVKITKGDKFLFAFTVRPLSETEVVKIRKASAKYVKNPAGKHLPKVETEVDYAQMKSRKIYMATIEEDKKKIWDNPEIKEQFNLVEGWEAVDVLLSGGWKNAVSEIIDNISGYDIDLTEYAKN